MNQPLRRKLKTSPSAHSGNMDMDSFQSNRSGLWQIQLLQLIAPHQNKLLESIHWSNPSKKCVEEIRSSRAFLCEDSTEDSVRNSWTDRLPRAGKFKTLRLVASQQSMIKNYKMRFVHPFTPPERSKIEVNSVNRTSPSVDSSSQNQIIRAHEINLTPSLTEFAPPGSLRPSLFVNRVRVRLQLLDSEKLKLRRSRTTWHYLYYSTASGDVANSRELISFSSFPSKHHISEALLRRNSPSYKWPPGQLNHSTPLKTTVTIHSWLINMPLHIKVNTKRVKSRISRSDPFGRRRAPRRIS